MRHLAAFATTLTLIAAAAAALGLAVAHPAATARARAPMQAAASGAIRVVQFTSAVEWSAAPGTEASLEVRDRRFVKWRGKGVSDGGGILRFSQEQIGRGTLTATFLLPGDTILIQPSPGQGLSWRVPDLRVAVDPDADRLSGVAPPGATITATVRPDPALPAVIVRNAQADAAGHWSLPLAGAAELAAGSDGWVELVDEAGHRTLARFAALTAEVTLGQGYLAGRGTLGDDLRFRIISPEGRVGPIFGRLLYGLDPGRPAGGFEWTHLEPVVPGSQLRLIHTGSLGGPATDDTATIPDLEIALGPGSGRVTGKGPANTPLTIELAGPDGTTLHRAVNTNAAGAFTTDFAPEVIFGRGWQAWAVYDAGDGIRVRAHAVIPWLRVGVYTPLVEGRVDPMVAVSATLRTAAGAWKAEGRTSYTGLGAARRWGLEFWDPRRLEVVPADPGDMIDIDLTGDGDPARLVVPRMTAQTDPDADTVTGEAIPGARVRVTAPTLPEPTTIEVDADGSGRYEARFAGQVDIEPPMIGTVEATDRSGHAFAIEWAAVRLTAELDSGRVSGTSPAGRNVALTLLAPDQRELGAVALRPRRSDVAEEWTAGIVDGLGQALLPRTGDLLRAVVGDDSLSMVIPPLSGAIHVEEDRVTGQGPPDSAIRLWGDVLQAPITVTTDAGGFFSHSFAGAVDFQYNQRLQAEAQVGLHRARTSIATPGLRLHLGDATLTGTIEPDLAIQVVVRNAAGTVRATETARTDQRAQFDLTFRSPAGEPLSLEAGDTVEVLAPDAEIHKRVAMTVPELVIDPPVNARLTGRATPGGRLAVRLAEAFPHGDGRGEGGSEPEIRADGAWQAAFDHPVMFRPGAQITAEYTLPSGHIALRDFVLPLANVQHGGANVCGVAARRTEVHAAASDAAGTELLAGSATAGPRDMRYALSLRDPTGSRVATEPGMTVRVAFAGPSTGEPPAGASSAFVTLPPVSLVVDWTTGEVRGTGPPRAEFAVSVPAFGCFGDARPGARLNALRGRTGDDGGFSIDTLRLDPTAPGLEIAFFTREGHRFYRQVFRSFGQVYLHTDRVAGRATPISPVVVVLLDAGGAELARAAAVADSDGNFEVRLLDGDGAPIAIEAGDRIRLEAAGESPLIEVERLDFDFSDSGIEGVAPAGRAVRLTLKLDDGRAFEITRQADDRGRWDFVPATVPPRAGWTVDQIRHVRAVLETAGGHEIVVETAGEQRAPVVYLPWAQRSR